MADQLPAEVALEPPLTRRGLSHGQPLTTGPRYIRTAAMSRWHRPRDGVRLDHGAVYGLWCGQTAHEHRGLLTADQVPDGLPTCGTCEGRAAGAGQDSWTGVGSVVFSPRRLTPPARCPGSRTTWCEELGNNVARCLACGAYASLRASGGGYDPRWGLVNHPPGPGLVAGCPFHAWHEMTLTNGRVQCRCGHTTKETEDA
ncbi:hypothetical protein HII36_54105 [Nonomuraea sp. NN258]|uniref:hypothetical protein n=1 Tax=Nonomuraea antri TaxID=2730852 RepID=UPI001568F362|nr:hypothetical protein [Nonomuraea antri]NRQ40690.1 hypothetical protein [Nonomuraea antri]